MRIKPELNPDTVSKNNQVHEVIVYSVAECARMRECVSAWLRECVSVWVRECECVSMEKADWF